MHTKHQQHSPDHQSSSSTNLITPTFTTSSEVIATASATPSTTTRQAEPALTIHPSPPHNHVHDQMNTNSAHDQMKNHAKHTHGKKKSLKNFHTSQHTPNTDKSTANMTCTNNRRKVYIGNLNPITTERQLFAYFHKFGQIDFLKVLLESGSHTTCFGFVEYKHEHSAEKAVLEMNGKMILDRPVKVSWAVEAPKEGYHLFIGDLGYEVGDGMLQDLFSEYPSFIEARVMWDRVSNRSRGFGFVSFAEKSDAEQALVNENSKQLGTKTIRLNWANQKQNTSRRKLEYEAILNKTSAYHTTVYVGKIPNSIQENDLYQLFQPFGYILELKFNPDKKFAFVYMDSHENAALAIMSLDGRMLNGQSIKCAWGKESRNRKSLHALTLNSSQMTHHPPHSPLPLMNDSSLTAAVPLAAAGMTNPSVYGYPTQIGFVSPLTSMMTFNHLSPMMNMSPLNPIIGGTIPTVPIHAPLPNLGSSSSAAHTHTHSQSPPHSQYHFSHRASTIHEYESSNS